MLYIFIVLAIVITETLIKNHMDKNKDFKDRQEIFGGRIVIRKLYNRGMFLNFLEDKKEIVKTVSGVLLGLLLLLFAIMLPKKGNRLFKLGLAFLLGGAASNVLDRMKRGYVVDYFSFNCKKLKNVVFNLSDLFIFLGAGLITLSSLLVTKFDGCSDKTAE